MSEPQKLEEVIAYLGSDAEDELLMQHYRELAEDMLDLPGGVKNLLRSAAWSKQRLLAHDELIAHLYNELQGLLRYKEQSITAMMLLQRENLELKQAVAESKAGRGG